jgi:hypothetical protein
LRDQEAKLLNGLSSSGKAVSFIVLLTTSDLASCYVGEICLCDPSGDILLVMSRHRPSRSASAGNLTERDASIISQPDPEGEAMSSSFNEDTDQAVISISQHLDNGDIAYSKSPAANIRFLVSPRHMILAPSVFKTMLEGNSREGLKLRATG